MGQKGREVNQDPALHGGHGAYFALGHANSTEAAVTRAHPTALPTCSIISR